MTLASTLASVVAALDAAGIPHMLGGSAASGYHGEPRSTRDVDLVIDPDEPSLRTFLADLNRERFYVDDALAAFRHRSMFNVIDMTTGWKVDLIVRKNAMYAAVAFGRRQRATVEGVAVFIESAEDSVLSKLVWARESESERQRRDIVGVLRIKRGELDLDYLWRWADELGVAESLEAALRVAATD